MLKLPLPMSTLSLPRPMVTLSWLMNQLPIVGWVITTESRAYDPMSPEMQ